jgi:hypothetical protein
MEGSLEDFDVGFGEEIAWIRIYGPTILGQRSGRLSRLSWKAFDGLGFDIFGWSEWLR